MKYCRRCVIPDTRPNIVFDAHGVCNACRSHNTRSEINWSEREESFRRVVANAQQRSSGYDCLIPVSGGKDSTWQVIKCLEYGLNPLAVTWVPPGRTEIGQANLNNLVRLGVDHIDYKVNPKVEAKLMVEALNRMGSAGIPMHLGLFNIPLTIAARFRIPLVVWGENSAFEYGSTGDASQGFKLDDKWLRTFGVTHGTTAGDWISSKLTRRELTPYFGPNDHELEEAGVLAVFLGYYFPWDPETSLRVAEANGFQRRKEGAKTGLYDYADIDDDFISIHHWFKWHKYGFTRLFDNLSLEIRNSRMTREEAISVIAKTGDQTPYADIDRLCRFTGLSPDTLTGIANKFRNPTIWSCQDGKWVMKDFIIKDWGWNEDCRD